MKEIFNATASPKRSNTVLKRNKKSTHLGMFQSTYLLQSLLILLSWIYYEHSPDFQNYFGKIFCLAVAIFRQVFEQAKNRFVSA